MIPSTPIEPSSVPPTCIVLYIGPDVLLPITSALAAAAGLLLMFWNRVVGVARSAWRAVFRRGE